MQGDDPPYLPVGTAVSAKYKGAFCEAKVSKVVRCVKCKISYKMGLGIATVTDEQIKGPLRVGHTVQARHTDKKEFIEATITKIQDCSQYTVVFDDGDITTLRRTALCLKSGRHFNESETLDQLPLTHPEHFGNPVVGGRRGRRSRQLKEDSSEGEPEEEAEPDLDLYSSDIGKVVCIEGNDKKKSRENWFPGLVVVPSAQPTVRINVREEYLIRSFKDGRYYTVPKKEISEFSRDMTARVESTALTEAMEKAIKYLDRDELPVHWERSTLFNLQAAESDSDDNMSNSSDDEPREEKDHFVAQLYKFLDDRGTPLNKTPTIANREIDLYRLFRVVEKFGGFNRVTNQTKWRSVSIRLGYPNNHATYNSVKQAYKKYIFNFEEFYRKLGCTMINHPRSAKKHRGRSLIRDRDRATPVNSPRPDEVVTPAPEEPKELKEPPPPTATVAAPPVPVNVKPAKVSKEEKKVEMLASDSSNSSDAIIDVQSDSSEKKIKEEKKKEVAVKVKERKVKAATGEKVKALVEQFEEQQTSTTKKEPKPPPAPPVADDDKEKIQQTRSKSQLMPKKELTSSPDRKDAPSRLAKPIKKPEEEKKRGRKRKDTETSSETKAAVDLSPETVLTQSINIGDKLKVYYGPTHESKVTYEAKVLEIDKDTSGTIYLVHYTGWNTRYDEWIKPVRIAENLSLTTKAKRLKQGQGPSNKNQSTPPKAAGKRGRGTSISSRSEPPGIPRSTTPSSVTSSSSRTKSPATPASKSTSRVTRQGGDTHRRTRRTSAHTDLSLASDSDSSHQSSSDTEELATRTRSSASKVEEKKKLLKNIKKEEDSDKEDEVIIERPKRKKKKVLEIKPSTESDEDSTPPPKGRDFDLNQIRSELKGFEKAVKIPVTPETPEPPVVVEEKLIDIKVEKKEKEEDKTDDIYEFKEPEPFEFEARAPTKLSEDKSSKKRVAKVYEEAEKSPKKKGKSPPKVDEEKKQRGFISKQRKEDDNLEEETISPIKTEDPFDKLVESPSFNIGGKKSPEPSKSQAQARVVKALNMDETLSLFRDIPETVGDDSRDRLELSDTDDTQTEPLFTHKEQIFLDPSITKPELDTIFRFAEADPKNTKEEEEEDSISAAIQRAISNTMTDEDTSDDIFMPQSTTSYQPIKIDPTPSPTPPDINKEPDLDTPKLISPALQETDSSLLISLQTELLIKQEDVQEVPIKTGTKIADSILQKFNLIKKSEEDPKIITAPPPPPPLREKTPEPPLPDPPAVVVPPPEPAPEIFPESNKKRAKKIVSREFLSDTDDSSDSEERLVIARSDEDDDSQTTNPSKDTDSNVSVAPPEVMVVVEDPIPPEPRNFKLDLIKAEPEEQQPEPVPEPDTKQPVKEEEDSNISLLLCKETIPGSPAPVTEPVPVVVEPRTKPKSAKSLLLEMPFASAPGSSNSKPIMANTVEPVVEADEKQAPLAVPLELPLEAASQPNNNTVIENTPPTTPESTISNLSPRGDQDRISPTVADNESCKSTDSGQQRAQTSKITHYSEEDTLMNVVESCPVVPKKSSPPQVTAPTRPPPDEVPAGPCRKRRRSCKSTTEDVVPPPVKRGRRPNVRNLRAQSDSDSDTHSAPGSTPPTTTTTGLSLIAAISTAPMDGRIRSRSPRPSKYNFIIELDPAMNSTQRIALIQQNFSDLRRTYNHFKTELACIDRRRKKLRRREREALKAAKQEMACT